VQALAPEEPQVTARLTALGPAGARATRPCSAGRRRRVPLPPPPDPRRGLRLAAKERPGGAARALRQTGSFSHTELVELDEIVGYHLEQAVGYRRELGKPVEELAERAAERLAASGRRALWREDRRAARALFERALELTRPFRLDVLLEVDLAATLLHRGLAPARQRSSRGGRASGCRGRRDRRGVRTCDVRLTTRFNINECTADELETLLLRALPLLEREADHAALVYVWEVFAVSVNNARQQWADSARASRRALEHAMGSLASNGRVSSGSSSHSVSGRLRRPRRWRSSTSCCPRRPGRSRCSRERLAPGDA